MMLRDFIVVAVWIVVTSNAGLGLLAQESGLVFRFDPNKSLSFRSDADGMSKLPVSPDGKMRIVVDLKKIRVLSDRDDTLLHEIATPNRAMAPTFSPDHKSLVFADCTGNLACESLFYVHHLQSGEQSKLGSCFGVTTRIMFSANGKRVAAVSIYDPIMALLTQQQLKKSLGGEIVVFDVATKAKLLHLAYDKLKSESTAPEAASQIVDEIALDNDGMTLLVTAKSGVVKVIDVNTGSEKISITTQIVGQPSED